MHHGTKLLSQLNSHSAQKYFLFSLELLVIISLTFHFFFVLLVIIKISSKKFISYQLLKSTVFNIKLNCFLEYFCCLPCDTIHIMTESFKKKHQSHDSQETIKEMLEITNFSFDSIRLMAWSLLDVHKMLWSMKIDIKWKLVVMSYSSRNHDIIWYTIELNRFDTFGSIDAFIRVKMFVI